jgi:hypothetical protein
MQDDDFSTFRKMISLTAEQYGKQLSPELIRFYFDGLSHLPVDSVREALNKHIRNTESGQFMPKIADLIRALDGRSQDAAYAALVELQEAFGSVGAWKSIEFADKISMAIVHDMGGWPALCGRDSVEWAQFGANDFLKRYRIYKDRGECNAPAYLPGYFEHNPQGTTEQRVLVGEKRMLRLENKTGLLK